MVLLSYIILVIFLSSDYNLLCTHFNIIYMCLYYNPSYVYFTN